MLGLGLSCWIRPLPWTAVASDSHVPAPEITPLWIQTWQAMALRSQTTSSRADVRGEGFAARASEAASSGCGDAEGARNPGWPARCVALFSCGVGGSDGGLVGG